MGNHQGKSGDAGFVKYDPSTVGTRKTMAAWHRYGVSVWDVYELVDELGQGHMGEVLRVRRKARGAHNEATRQGSQKEEAVAADPDKTPKTKKKTFKVPKVPKVSGKPSKSKSKEVDAGAVAPARPELAETPKEPPRAPPPPPSSILKESKYPSAKIPAADIANIKTDDDDEEEEEDASRYTKQQERADEISAHRKATLEAGERGDLDFSVRTVDPLVPDSPKVGFKRDYACKTVLISHIKDGKMVEMMNEIYVMRSLDHPYILQLYEIYQVKRKLWLITELCTGGDLTSRSLIEPEVAVVMEQILRALAYMHGQGIVHHDLKLENVLYENRKPDASIRLIDFGLSKTYDRAVVSRKAVGAAYTLAPEIVSKTGTYTAKTDIWSLGVCAFILLSGDFPFVRTESDFDDKFKLNNLINAKFKFGMSWSGRGITNAAKTFVTLCLKKNPDDRWSAKEALEFVKNKWIPAIQEAWKESQNPVADLALKRTISAQRETSTGSMDLSTEDIQRFCTYGRMKKTILMAMAHTMDRDDVGRLSEIFLRADTEDTGTLNFTELKNAITEVNPSMDDKSIEKIFKGIDQDESGEIHYMEFLAALAESQGLVTMERLAEAFDRIDADGKGYITHDDLRMVLGKDYDQETVNRMIKEADFKKNGQVDYEELLRLMFEDPSSAMDTVGDVTESLRKLEGFEDIILSGSTGSMT